MNVYRACIRPLVFRGDAERVHDATLRGCGIAGRSRLLRDGVARVLRVEHPSLRTEVAGLTFSNPVGLAAGFDKNAHAAGLLPSLGFGFIEIGSVSADPSPGNTVRPRLWRMPADDGLMVYYGVPSDGAAVVAARVRALVSPPSRSTLFPSPLRGGVRGGGKGWAQRLRLTPKPGPSPQGGGEKLAAHRTPLGISLVETNHGGVGRPVDAVIEEMVTAAAQFVGLADYFALNLHCPNSGGASPFDEPRDLGRLLERFCAIPGLPPVLIKITPPADPAVTDRMLLAIDPFPGVRGFILNTHAPRPYTYVRTPQAELAGMRGSMTGAWLREPVNTAIRDWYRRIDRKRHVLVGVGGIGSAADAYQTIRLGASLVEVLTALVYAGPGLVRDINRGLVALLARDGLASIADAVGIDNRQTAVV